MYQSLPRTNKYCVKLLLLCSVFHLCSAISGQSTGRVPPKINLSAKNVTITDVFKAIKSQTGKIVWFMNEEVNADRKVTVNFQNATLDEVMEYLFGASSDFTWSVDEEKVILRKKKLHSDNVITSNVSSVKVDSLPGTITVTGKVTDEKGSPIIGATVVVAGTRKGTTTGVDGGFVLEGVKSSSLLAISSVGFLTREIAVQKRLSVGNIKLKIYVNALDETIIIAYGTTTKRFSTGNVSSIKATDIEKQPINNPLLALQGRIPGLFITQASGLPGSGVIVRLQGQNSIRSGNDPLYVIDGVPFISQLLPTINYTLGGSGNTSPNNPSGAGNPLSFINPADIESIDVLKDAAATAIYGSRAANGAILITTKKGKSGDTKVDINVQNGSGKVTREMNLLNTQQYLKMRREALINDGVSSSITDYDINGFWDTTRYENWQKELLGNTAKYLDAQASASGGGANTQFLIGAGYHRETTVFPGNLADQKGSLHFSITNTSTNQKFRIQFSGNYLIDNSKLISTDLTSLAITIPPDAPSLYNKDGSLNWMPKRDGSSTWTNPLSYLYNRYNNRTSNLVSNALLSYQVLSGLDIKSSFGYTKLESKEISINSLLAIAPEIRPFESRSSVFSNGSINSWIIEPQATYKNSIWSGRMEVLLGATIQQNNNEQQLFVASGFNNDLVMDDIKSAPNVTVQNSLFSIYKYNALFGRVNYNIKDKYIIDLTARRDGTSRFGPRNQFHNFASFALGWIFSSESFVKDKFQFLSFGKLRGSYGTVGNDQIGDYQYLNLYVPTSANVPYQNAIGLSPNSISNPYLQWEETRKMQFGIDLGFLNDRILVNANYFYNNSSNQLLPYTLPIVSGFSSVTRNFPAKVKNSGLELSLYTINFKHKYFNWTSNFNFTALRNKLVDFPNLSNSSYSYSLVVGRPITIERVYRFAGVNKISGVYQFTDSHGENIPNPDYLTDRTVNINTSPEFFGGFQNTFVYKGVELDFLFQFVKKKGLNYRFGILPGTATLNQPTTTLNNWKKSGDEKDIQRYNSNFSFAEQFSNAYSSDAGYADASYVRLKTLSLSWQLPINWRQKLKVQNWRIYLHAQNVITLTHFKGLDPETLSSLPPLKVFTFGLQITL